MRYILIMLSLVLMSSAHAIDVYTLVNTQEFKNSMSFLAKYAAKKKTKDVGMSNAASEMTDGASGVTTGLDMFKRVLMRNSPDVLAGEFIRAAMTNQVQVLQSDNGLTQVFIVSSSNVTAHVLQLNHETQTAVVSRYKVEDSGGYNTPPSYAVKQAALDYNRAMQMLNNNGGM